MRHCDAEHDLKFGIHPESFVLVILGENKSRW